MARMIDDEGLDLEILCLMCTNPIKSDRGCDGGCRYDENTYKAIIDALERRMKEPRAKGHWIALSDVIGVAYCSECNYQITENNTNFCPNCGADMREEQDG